jgi:hyperosmotically inducible protein
VTRYPALLLSILLPLAAACGPSLAGTGDDLTITTRVKTALLNDREIGGARIDVETLKGVVTLSGTVATAAERDKAVAITRKVTGVRDVQSALKIQP